MQPKGLKFEKQQKEQEHQFKLDLFEQFCDSVKTTLFDPDEDGMLFEVVRGHKYQYKKLEYNRTFGILILHFVDTHDVSKTFRLPLELKRA